MNRAASNAAIDASIAEALSRGAWLSVLCLDLDGFKAVKDKFGHRAGDEVLQAYAGRIKRSVRRGSDVTGRLDGDEFVIALRDFGPFDLALCDTAATLLQALQASIQLRSGERIEIGASTGIACVPTHGENRSSVTHATEVAMYEVKRSGKNSFALALPFAASCSVSGESSTQEASRPAPAPEQRALAVER